MLSPRLADALQQRLFARARAVRIETLIDDETRVNDARGGGCGRSERVARNE